MTTEERREYMREWRKNNKDKIREQQMNRARRGAIAELKSLDGDPRAILEWLKNHRISDNKWIPIAGYWREDGFPVVVLHNESQEYGYAVQCAGSGNYFKTKEEAYQFMETWNGRHKLKAT